MRSIPSFVHVRCGRRLLSTVTSTQVATRSAPVIAWSGARQLNIAETTNTAILSSYATKLENYINNDSVGLIAFSADGGKFFSKHMDQDPATVKTINQLNEKLMSYPKHTMLYAEGDISSSAFGTFSGCKYRLGGESTKLVLDDFSKGRIPIGGGISAKLVGGKRDGVAMARYLVSAQVSLNAFDMHKLGLLTHVVPDGALEIVLPVVADVSCLDMTKAFQPRSDKIDSLGELLDSMHVEVKELSGVFTHAAWSKAVLVPPSQYMNTDEPDETVDAIREQVVHCFSPDEPEECLKRLELVAADESNPNQQWAKSTLSVMQKNDQSLMKTWFQLTKIVAKKTVSQAMQIEEQLVNTK